MPLSTTAVNAFSLIISLISSLSTILYFGAKLISLYFFLSKIGGKITGNRLIYAENPPSGRVVAGYFIIIHKLLTDLCT